MKSFFIAILCFAFLPQAVVANHNDTEKPFRPFDGLGVCGLDCLAIGDKDEGLLKKCLTNTTIDQNVIVTRDDGEKYDDARRTRQGYLSRYPHVVVFAQNANDVVEAVTCAVHAGYPVSAVGGRHKEYGILDGYVVIDSSNLIQDAIHNEENGTLTVGAGYTHGMMVHALRENAPPNAMLSIGNGGSVGFIGYMIGAGLGYASPAVGLGCDSIREIEVVMVDGEKGIRKVRATHDNEYSDILWSFCGGGFGLGIITEVTVAYTLAEVTEFAYGNVTFKVQDSIPKQAKMIADVFDFFASPDNKHFGGQVWVGPKRFGFNGLFQGNVDNFTALMKTRDLDKYVESYNMSETEKFPIASAYFVCRLLTLNAGPKNESVWGGIADTLQNLTGRDDLVLQNFTEYNYCRDVEILDALITLGGDRQSFVSYGLHPANDPKDAEEAMDWETYSNVRNTTGKVRFYPKPTSGMLEVMLELLGEHKVDFLSVVRLASGKVMEKDSDETAFVWRDHPLMMRTPFQVLKPMWAALKQMYGAENIGGYHGLSDSFDSNWQYTYYGDNYERAGMIRAKYDILNTFGKKLTPDQIFGEPVFPPECCVCKGGKKGGKLLNCDCSTCDGDA